MQMPRFGKDYRMYNRILPSLNLDISDLLEGCKYVDAGLSICSRDFIKTLHDCINTFLSQIKSYFCPEVCIKLVYHLTLCSGVRAYISDIHNIYAHQCWDLTVIPTCRINTLTQTSQVCDNELQTIKDTHTSLHRVR